VASELFVSIKTVQFHLTHIYSKLRVSSRTALAARFHQDAAHKNNGDDDPFGAAGLPDTRFLNHGDQPSRT